MKNKSLLVFLIVVIIITAFALLYKHPEENNYEGDGNERYQSENITIQKFRNADLGISFEYRTQPDGYTLTNQSSKENAPVLESLSLMKTDQYEELVKDMESGVAREGPPSISIRIFENKDNLSPKVWAENHAAWSNYSLAVAPGEEIMLGGAPAVTYTIDGLYRTDVFIVNNNFKIYVIQSDFTDPSIDTKTDSEKFLQSVLFF